MIDLLPSSDEQQLVDTAAAALAGEFPVSRLNGKSSAPGADAARLGDMAEFGWLSLCLGQAHTDTVFSLPEKVLVFREMGRFLLSPILLACAIGAELAARAGLSALKDDIARGAARVGLAALRRPGSALAGAEVYLIDSVDAEFVLLWTEHGIGLFPAGMFKQRKAVEPVEEALSLERALLDGGAATAWTDQSDLLLQTRLLFAAQLAGIAEATRDMAVDYAKIREQFGQPIGSFQAIKHRCADMAVRAEAGWAQTLLAGVTDQIDEHPFHVTAAMMLACDAALQNSFDNIQVHGGMGFTADCQAHLYLKRAHTLRLILRGNDRLDDEMLRGQGAASWK